MYGFKFPSTLESFKLNRTYNNSLEEVLSFDDSVVSEDGTSLKTLMICNVAFSDVSFLNDLSNLTIIELSLDYITTLEGISSTLSNVTSLNLSYNNLTSLYGIQYFTGLQTLDISYNTTLGDTASYNGRR